MSVGIPFSAVLLSSATLAILALAVLAVFAAALIAVALRRYGFEHHFDR